VRLRRRVELETLFTHPKYQGNGVGSALLQWGLDEADRLGLMIYLEATEEGRPLYERFGFEAIKVVKFDAGAFGGVGKHQYTVSEMVQSTHGIANMDSLCFASQREFDSSTYFIRYNDQAWWEGGTSCYRNIDRMLCFMILVRFFELSCAQDSAFCKESKTESFVLRSPFAEIFKSSSTSYPRFKHRLRNHEWKPGRPD
jgi:hypothetical protein